MKPFKTAATYAADLQQAYDYFGQGGPRAAERFWERYYRALQVLMMNPQACRLRPSGWRQMGVAQSSYAIFYREAPDFWFLGGVVSTVQDPDLIQARLLIREVGDVDQPAK
jgi:plasmid stabilization system protein ParE